MTGGNCHGWRHGRILTMTCVLVVQGFLLESTEAASKSKNRSARRSSGKKSSYSSSNLQRSGFDVEGWLDPIAMQESRGNPRAVGKNGERGKWQILESTWKWAVTKLLKRRISFSMAFHEATCRRVAKTYLVWLDKTIRRDLGRRTTPEHILAAYNGGIGRLKRRGYRISRMPRSTQRYVVSVKRWKKKLK